MIGRRLSRMAAAAGIAAAFSVSAFAQGTVRIGGLATLDGPFVVLGQEGFRAMELALEEANYTAGGRKIEWIKESSDGRPTLP
jgi:branched-chain amino acid transport system substrate-binding protein